MQQFILPLFVEYTYHPDEFIVTPSNAEVYGFVTENLEKWRGVRPYEFSCLIAGPTSSGKTYLVKIWQNTHNAYLIPKNSSNINQNILDGYPAFILEDIDKNWHEETLLHHFNIINEQKKYLLLTSSNLSNNFCLKDLSSRIRSLFNINLNPPDDELIKTLLFKHFATNSLKVENQVIEFLLKNLPRQFHDIINAAKKINDFALMHKRNITIPLVKEAINIDLNQKSY